MYVVYRRKTCILSSLNLLQYYVVRRFVMSAVCVGRVETTVSSESNTCGSLDGFLLGIYSSLLRSSLCNGERR